jgi:4-diphosphocytidyl-2-C-methyl-D-erythritol kinase
MIELPAPAKVNLFLRILAREDSGFHQIETLFCALEFGDRVCLEPSSSGVSLDVIGPLSVPEAQNLAHRAAQGFMDECRTECGVRIHLVKEIPPGAGLGGGSSDAGSTLRGLDSLYPGSLSRQDLFRIAGTLGSDVPFFLSSSPLALAWGRGDRLLPLAPLPSRPVVLALPPISVSTPEAYGLLDREKEEGRSGSWAGAGLVGDGGFSSWSEIGSLARNDFETVIFRTHPLLRELRERLKASGAMFSLLSGSGAALFGVFQEETVARTALESMESRFPDTRFILTRTASSISGPLPWTGGLNR